MGTFCGQTSQLTFWCAVYDFQTLLTGFAAICAALFAGIPVWRQLRDSNFQTRISRRETLAKLLRNAQRRFAKVEKEMREPLSLAVQFTIDPDGEPIEIDTNDAHDLDQVFHGLLNWYLVVLADTEHDEIEAQKSELKAALIRLRETLHDAHWADINSQRDEFHDVPNEEWACLVTRCAEAKIEATERVSEVAAAYSKLGDAQGSWVRSLRAQIAKLDLQIATAR